MQAHLTEIVYYDLADIKICNFIRKLRDRYGPLDPDTNEDCRSFLIEEGIINDEEVKT